ncbi:DUF58 domain-containing protein [Planobacterium oryzisoli]|uniref:DUF58 domain-containing protein n=1 Tax=Planobacterium oryzisoli TaxID=2771435 RepID=A0A930YUJ4_9FLAO|nr:DUF58 domain-containing protein [Planobacterium oryzisoli]MBF5026606.1 DUF58 domain-containing protein [Planobacterium oryzisoli]
MQIKDIVRKVKQIEIRTRRQTESALMGQYHSALKGQGMTFSEVRPLQHGDDVRRMDWNKTARFQEPFVKIMEEERELTVLLVLDISASMDYGTGSELKREYMAQICASIGFSAVGNNDKVGLILYADRIVKVVPARKGRKHMLSLIATILQADYLPAESSLDTTFQYLMNVFKKKSFVFVLSDFQDPVSKKLLPVVAKKHALLALRIYDEKDQQIPSMGFAQLKDSETGKTIWVNTSSKRWRYEFAERQRMLVKEKREQFESASAGFLNLATSQDYSKELYNYFSRF